MINDNHILNVISTREFCICNNNLIWNGAEFHQGTVVTWTGEVSGIFCFIWSVSPGNSYSSFNQETSWGSQVLEFVPLRISAAISNGTLYVHTEISVLTGLNSTHGLDYECPGSSVILRAHLHTSTYQHNQCPVSLFFVMFCLSCQEASTAEGWRQATRVCWWRDTASGSAPFCGLCGKSQVLFYVGSVYPFVSSSG